jgi:hypothetical protein
LAAGACKNDPFDPLDPDNIGDLGNDMGDAKGEGYSGKFALELTPLDCDCPPLFPEDFENLGAGLGLEPGDTIDPCSQIAIFYGSDAEAVTQAELVQADGLLAFTDWLPPLSGPVDADGSFSVGGYEDFSETFVDAAMVVRIDGEFGNIDGFFGVLQQRVIANLLDRSVDCRSTHQIDGVRVVDEN